MNSAYLRSAARGLLRRSSWLICAGGLLLAGCQTEQPGIAMQPRGATVAFDSIDGLPPAQFQALVDDLNTEARTRRIAVASRAQASAYRVRGYFAAAVEKKRTTLSWVFDVFDRDQQRAFRISGSAPANGRDWKAADSSLMQKIAHTSMDELAGFLTAVNSGTPGTESPQLALAADGASPAAAGIFSLTSGDPPPGPAADAGR